MVTYNSIFNLIILIIYLYAFLAVMTLMLLLWIISIPLKNVSIVDMFWGIGFVIVITVYVLFSENLFIRELLVSVLVAIWGFRLSFYLMGRNYGKPEDFRYQEFRKEYGAHRYWWFSFFQVFLLQGVLIMIVSLPLLGIHEKTLSDDLNFLDYVGITIWIIGFVFESVGDYQLTQFKKEPTNKDKVLDSGLWRYTRHPNYFGDAMVWWSFGVFSIAAGAFWHIVGTLIMTYLIVNISGVALLEKSLNDKKPKYWDYIKRTNAFFPWFPKKTL